MKSVLDEEYLNWLDQFTINKQVVMNDLYCDSRAIGIEELFDKINKYAKENYLVDSPLYGEMYYFRHNDVGYEIGMLYGPNIVYYVKRIEIKEDNFIDINDVRSNIIPDKSKKIAIKMNTIKDAMNELANMGVPLDIVNQEIHEMNMELRRVNNGNNCCKQ